MEAQPDGIRAVMTASAKLAVVELLDRDGHARLAVPVLSWPITIGRAIDCDVVLDDVHAAARHATLAEQDGVLTLVVGETVNGVQVSRQRLAPRQSLALPAGEIFQIGQTRLRVRRASDALSPERPFVPEPAAGRVPLVLLALVLALWNVTAVWQQTDPDGKLTAYLPLLGVPVMLAMWAGLWSIGSKLVRQRFDFWRHVRVAVGYTLIIDLLGTLLPLAAYSLGIVFLSRISGIAAGSAAWAMVLAHLVLILPARRRVLTAAMGVLLIAGVSLFVFRNYQIHDRPFTELYVTRFGPPALRLAPAVATTRFLDEARGLKSVLDAHARDQDAGAPAQAARPSPDGANVASR